jgi:nucleoside-triphosphatase THEP1
MNDQYSEALEIFLAKLERIPGGVALTLDGWSSRVMKGYLVITVHWIDEDWAIRHAVLEFTYFPRPHNQETTSALIISILKEFNIHTRVRAITTDSGGEMIPAIDRVRRHLIDNLAVNVGTSENFHIRCVCHVINRSVVDAIGMMKSEVGKIRNLLKLIRGSGQMRQKYADLSVVLGRAQRQSVPNLDVETRWNSMFLMIEDCFKNRDILESLCNQAEFMPKLEKSKLSDDDWRVLKSSKDFLEAAYKCTNAASGQNYATLAMQPLIYSHLNKLCDWTIAGNTATGFTTPAVQNAAKKMSAKLAKYGSNPTNSTAMIALFLDPRRSSSDASQETKELVRQILALEYDYTPKEKNAVDTDVFNLFAMTGSPQNVSVDEVEDFIMMTLNEDVSCMCPVAWWKQQSQRFPTLSLLARDTLMIMGSSVPSESAFSDSGDFISDDR